MFRKLAALGIVLIGFAMTGSAAQAGGSFGSNHHGNHGFRGFGFHFGPQHGFGSFGGHGNFHPHGKHHGHKH